MSIDPESVPPELTIPVFLDPEGVRGPTPGQARGKKWRRSTHGRYVPSEVSDERVEQRILEAACVLTGGSAVTGWAALRWMGGHWFTGQVTPTVRRPVTLAIGTRDTNSRPLIAVTGEGVGPHAVMHLGLPVTTPVFSVSFEMRYARTDWEAAQVLDMACYSDLVSINEVREFLATQNAWTGIPRARASVDLAQENVWSPPEGTMCRLWAIDTPFGWPECNRPVFDLRGRHVATPDLVDVEAGVYGQYDGAHHLERGQRDKDIAGNEALDALGLVGVTMTAADLHDPSAFRGRLRRAYARARTSNATRGWSPDISPWWVRTDTVERRRALSAEHQSRLLGYRRMAV